jgi:hypothetical protein
VSKRTSKAQRQSKPAHASTANAATKGQEAKDGANTSKTQPETWKDFLQTPDEVIRKMDEVIQETRAKWHEEHLNAPPKSIRSKQTTENVVERVLRRCLEASERKSTDASEWQIQTLMYLSGIVYHLPAGGAQKFEPSPALLDSPTLENRPVDNAPRVYWRTGEKLPCIDTTGSLRGTLDELRGQVDSDGKPCVRYTGKRAAELVTKAASDPLAWEAACLVAGHMLEQGDILPHKLNSFVSDILLKRASRPPKRPGRIKNAVRDEAIQNTARLLDEHFGFSPFMRNRKPKFNSRRKEPSPLPICDLLAAALGTMGENISSAAIEDILSPRVGYKRRPRQ